MNKSILASTLSLALFALMSCGRSESGSEQQVSTPEARITGLKTLEYQHIFEDERPFPQCHASTISPVGDGTYMIAWFAGSYEKHDDVVIWLSQGKLDDWSAPRMVAKIRNDPHWNPVLFNAPDGKMYLYFKVGKEIDHWETWVQYTDDNGKTWSEARELVPGDKGGRGPVRNHMLVLSDGTWLAPASLEDDRVWDVIVDRSEDGGKTWSATDKFELDREKIKGEGVIQPALWESKPGHVHMLIRSSSGYICRADSEDYGKSWTAITETDLPNNNSGIDVAHLGGEKIALIYNPVSGNWGKRYPITVAISEDNGKTWPVKYDIEKGENEKDELSYPAIFFEDGKLVACYTWNRERIAFWKGEIEREQ